MKYVVIPLLLLSGCSVYNANSQAERSLDARFDHGEYIYATYDLEYIDECLYYEDLVCEFE